MIEDVIDIWISSDGRIRIQTADDQEYVWNGDSFDKL